MCGQMINREGHEAARRWDEPLDLPRNFALPRRHDQPHVSFAPPTDEQSLFVDAGGLRFDHPGGSQ
jgi:hypothetical protein